MDNNFKTAMVTVFEKVAQPTNFISNFYKKEQLDGIKVEIQGRDVAAVYSVDTKLGTGGRRHAFSHHDVKEIEVPEYNDYTEISEEDVFKVQFGETKYTRQVASVINKFTREQKRFSEMQKRAEEKQAADAILNGKIVLADGSKIEFRKKSSHDIDCSSKKWNAAASGASSYDPLEAIGKACELCITDGKIGTSEFNFIAEKSTVNALLKNDYFRKNANMDSKIERAQITLPVEKTPGAFFHGQFAADSYIVNLWSYDAKYEIPTGFNFANQGQQTTYIPKGRAILLPNEVDFIRYYGAINDANFENPEFAIGKVLNLVKTEQLPTAYAGVKNNSVFAVAGLKSRPLYVPINIDASCTFSNIV